MTPVRKHDIILTFLTWTITVIGIITIYSITYNAENSIRGAGAANKQLLFALIGVVAYFLISFFTSYKYVKNLPILFIGYLGVIGLLILIFFISSANRGSIRWISIGPLNIEPSELAKILIIFFASYFLSESMISGNDIKNKVITVVGTIPVLVLIFKQPDLSTTLCILGIFGMLLLISLKDTLLTFLLILAGVIGFNGGLVLLRSWEFYKILRIDGIERVFESRTLAVIIISSILLVPLILLRTKAWPWFLGIVLFGGLCAFGYDYAWNHILHDYQKQRVYTFLNPEEDKTESGYQVNQSMIAVGSGMVQGRGFGRGTQSNLNFLPERHTDFIFASFAEEFGLIGTLTLLLLYGALIIRIVMIGYSSGDTFGFFVCLGVATMIFIQFGINVGMNIGIMPVTGITLPLMSYGGSSLLVTIASIAIVQTVFAGKEEIDLEKDSLVVRERN